MDLQARGQRRDLCAGHTVPEVTQDLFMLLITGERSKVAVLSSSCRTQITLCMSAGHKTLRVLWWPAKNSLIWDRRGFL